VGLAFQINSLEDAKNRSSDTPLYGQLKNRSILTQSYAPTSCPTTFYVLTKQQQLTTLVALRVNISGVACQQH